MTVESVRKKEKLKEAIWSHSSVGTMTPMYLVVSEDITVSEDYDDRNNVYKAVNSLWTIPCAEFYFIPQ